MEYKLVKKIKDLNNLDFLSFEIKDKIIKYVIHNKLLKLEGYTIAFRKDGTVTVFAPVKPSLSLDGYSVCRPSGNNLYAELTREDLVAVIKNYE